MTKKIIAIVILIIILLVAIFVDGNLRRQNNEALPPAEEEQEAVEKVLDIKHQYKDGNHVFVGEIELPTPCHSYNATATEVGPDEAIIQIEILDPDPDTVCAQVISERTFKVIYPGPEGVSFKAFVNGEEYRLNTFEIPDYVDIDQFEIYLKG